MRNKGFIKQSEANNTQMLKKKEQYISVSSRISNILSEIKRSTGQSKCNKYITMLGSKLSKINEELCFFFSGCHNVFPVTINSPNIMPPSRLYSISSTDSPKCQSLSRPRIAITVRNVLNLQAPTFPPSGVPALLNLFDCIYIVSC